MNERTIIRAMGAKDKKSFAALCATPQDRRLSWEARGMLMYLLSKPSDWEVQPKDLQQNCGRNKVYAILKELVEAGYLERISTRNEKGVFVDHHYIVREEPLPRYPEVDNPDVDNGDSYNIREITESENQQKDSAASAAQLADAVAGGERFAPESQETREPVQQHSKPKKQGEPDYVKRPWLYDREPVSDEIYNTLDNRDKGTALFSVVCWHFERSVNSPHSCYVKRNAKKQLSLDHRIWAEIRQVMGVTPQRLKAFITHIRKDTYGQKLKDVAKIGSHLRDFINPLQQQPSGGESPASAPKMKWELRKTPDCKCDQFGDVKHPDNSKSRCPKCWHKVQVGGAS